MAMTLDRLLSDLMREARSAEGPTPKSLAEALDRIGLDEDDFERLVDSEGIVAVRHGMRPGPAKWVTATGVFATVCVYGLTWACVVPASGAAIGFGIHGWPGLSVGLGCGVLLALWRLSRMLKKNREKLEAGDAK